MIVNLSKWGDKLSIKDAKLNFIVEVATKLFLEKGINQVTIRDIATAVGVGEATIYRYFSKKQNIVVASAMRLEDEVFNKYFALNDGGNGFEKLSKFYTNFLLIFTEHIEFYKFINDFDSYFINEVGDLSNYEESLRPFYKSYLDAYNLGLIDKSILKLENIELFYFTTTHSLLGLCKKLSYDKEILAQDSKVKKSDEIKQLISIILYSLKAYESNISSN